MANKDELLTFIENSPSMFHAVSGLKRILDNAGYSELKETNKWNVKTGGKYYVIRNGSSIIAFNLANKISDYHFQISASHSDSPTYKLKENFELKDNHYVRLDVEGYGGMIANTFFDKPLSIAGRVLVRVGNKYTSKLVNIDRDLLIISNLAIHMNRNVNEGYKYNNQVDLLPIINLTGKTSLMDLISKELKCKKENIMSHDLYLYNRTKPTTLGLDNELIASPKLDNLECAFSTFSAFSKQISKQAINVVACFDNEEVGSATKQGAGSTFLLDTLKRINASLKKSEDDYYAAIAKSFMISCDNAHAFHPNYPGMYDELNRVYMNEGIVIKYSANQKYTTDAISSSIIEGYCHDAKVKCQKFANRSDMVGGSTLGNISSGQVSLHTCDIGLAQLAMHSSYELAGSKDVDAMINLIKKFYSSNLKIKDNENFEVVYK